MEKFETVMKNLRKECLYHSFNAEEGNLQSTFSCMELMYVLYKRVINLEEDYFMLSKGQASLGQYVIMERMGLIDKEELKTFCQFSSKYGMQIDKTKNKYFDCCTGSLGHGFPVAVGVAVGEQIKKSNSKIYVLAGDGEFNEGTMWEAAILANSMKLNNLKLIIDNNDSINKMITLKNIQKKLKKFGFKIIMCDGYNEEEIYNALKYTSKKPVAIIAKTIRGYGCNTIMNKNEWFHKAPSLEDLPILLKEVEEFEKTDDRDNQ